MGGILILSSILISFIIWSDLKNIFVLFCLKQSGFRTPILGQVPIGLFVLDIIVIMEISFMVS